MAPKSKAKASDEDLDLRGVREQLSLKTQQADAAAVTISELREQLTAALADAAQKGAETDDVVEGIRKDLTTKHQQRAERLLAVERLHRDLAGKLDVSQAAVKQLQAEAVLQKRRQQKTEEDAQCNIDALCRDFVSMQRAILQQMAPVSTPDADNGQKPFQGCSLRKDELKES